jgi:alpha-glucoside transport system ATP-binding protein
MTGLVLESVRKSYGNLEVIRGVDLKIEHGEFVVFVGPSGCGKSTLLRMIAGLEEITSGTVKIGDRYVNNVPPSKRGIAMVFQSYALYPHMSVYDNMAFGMRIAKESKQEIDRRVRNAAEILQLTQYLERLPKALSGGQRQRVAIGRAICRNPKVFLFDEPLSNLDAALRVATRIEIAKLSKAMPDTTMIYVTHDQVEAMTLADRIVVLSAGDVEQVGTPLELYQRPANLFVARFIGSPAMNILSANVEDTGALTRVVLGSGKSVVTGISSAPAMAGQEVKFGIRPEDFRLAASDSDPVIFEGKPSIVEELGEFTLLYFDGAATDGPLVVKIPSAVSFDREQHLKFSADQKKMYLFDGKGRALK